MSLYIGNNVINSNFLWIVFSILFVDLYLLTKKYLKLKIEALQRENQNSNLMDRLNNF